MCQEENHINAPIAKFFLNFLSVFMRLQQLQTKRALQLFKIPTRYIRSNLL